ncbi:protein NLRC5-like [Carassius auratus]|uniref:Protein NLRC5-like n=1 Tax=Carassius auratus TaxID=7957 RepID=A0A6P6NY28_CARAU|nr:protein NLRC5-like [Carassius auratus]
MEIVQYIKQKLDDNLSPERSINLFYCLNELNDQTLVKEIQIHLNKGSLSSADLSPAQWSALAFVLLTSDEEMEEFELQKFKKSDECLIRLSPVIKTSRKAKLNNCNLTDRSCLALATVLGSDSNLKDLNMNNNNLQDSGLINLCSGLKSVKCELEILSLRNCDLTEESCSTIASVLSSDSSSLKDLDLSNNKLQDSGVMLLSDGLKENCKLEKLRLSNCSIAEEGYKALASALRSNPSHLIELDLRGNDPGESGVKELDDLLQDPNCHLKTLRFLGPAANEACHYVTGILGKNPLLLRDLNLSDRELGDTQVIQIAALLQDKHCKLNTLKLSDCSITEEGYKALASALRSNHSHLIELDLTGNDPGESGVKVFVDLQQDGCCKLKTIRFLKSPAAQEACEYLTEALGINPLLLKELDLSEDKLGDLDGEKLSDLLMDSHSKLEKIKLNNCELTEKKYSVLATVLSSKTILKEMELNNSRLLDSGVKEICEGLKNPVCELKILKLSDCSITEEGYKALASALRSNPSHLIELDLTLNDPGESGVKQLSDLLQDGCCKLTIRFLKSPAAQEACEYLTEALGINPLLLKELDLSEDKLGDLDGEKLSALLMDSHSKLEKMKLNNCELTEKNCSVLATVLSCKTILKELNLNNSCLLDSGVKEICEGLKNPVCELKILKLCDCGLTEESGSALATVLRSNRSLKELDISNNNLHDSGVKKLQDGLENTNCTLQKLKLSNCSITEEGYKALASALRSNPSYLIELDLTGNDPGQSGVKQLNDILQDPNCKLKTLRFLGPVADEACQYVTGIVGKNPLLLRELNLSELELGDTRVNQIAALLQDKHCKLNTLNLNNSDITEEDCQVLDEALNLNPSNLTELNLSGTKLRNSGMKIFSALFKNEQCRLKKLKLNSICITEEGCTALASAFNSNPSNLIELNLSGNKLGDSGVTEISSLLRNSQCSLQILRLSNCSITEEGYKALASALKSNPSHLIELDLTGNDPGQSGVKELDDFLQDPNCQLKTLRLLQSPEAEAACKYLTEVLQIKNPLLLRDLNLSERELGDTQVNQIAALLRDKHCKLNTLKLCDCGLTDESCSPLATVLRSNPSLIELDISNNKLQDSGVMKLQNGLEDRNCTLQKLRLSNCSITEEGYKALASALRSNPSHLIELDLTRNDPGESGVEHLSELQQDQNCKLKTLRVLRRSDADEGCQYVTGIVGTNPLLLRELNLSGCELGDTRVNQISALLKDKHCKYNTLTLCECSITEKPCFILTSALCVNLSHLKELNLSGNKIENKGVKHICEMLIDSRCKLERLRLGSCNLTDEGCSDLTSALKLNPSHLRELDLSENQLGDSGLKNICDLLMNPQCKLEKLDLNDCGITEVAILAQSLAENNALVFLKELDLSKNNIGHSKTQLIDVLRDSSCNLSL